MTKEEYIKYTYWNIVRDGHTIKEIIEADHIYFGYKSFLKKYKCQNTNS